MAYRLSLLCLATLTTLPIVAAAQTADIPAEILNFVPPCAQKCFQSFISANFDSDICGNSPSLQCLCRQQGTFGYTLGEGAVSCLVAESSRGACQGQDGGSDAKETAYYMCIGVSNAVSMTHSTILATLVLPSSGTGPLIVPTANPTTTGTDEATGTTTSMPTPTVRLPTGDEPSSTTATTSSSSSSAPSSTTATGLASPTQTAETGSGVRDGHSQLSSSQIAGIVLGSTAVIAFGILLVLLARCIRRRRFSDLESGFFNIRESVSFGKKSRPGSSHGVPHITGPLFQVQPQRNPADPRWQPGMPRAGVGLAISPLAARGGGLARSSPAQAPALSVSRPPTPPRKPSPVSVPKLVPPPRSVPKAGLSPAPGTMAPTAQRSPPKPTLTLAIPKRQERMVRAPVSSRDSVVTEFAEDGEGDTAPGPAIWRPPTSDPLSATTVYYADKGGNWILRNSSTKQPGQGSSSRAPGPTKRAIQEVPAAPVEVELPSPEHKTRAERARDAYGGFSPDAVVSPLRLPRKPGRQRLGSPISFKDQRREPQISSPSVSARLSQTAETIMSESPQASSQPIDTYFATVRESRDLTGGKTKRRSAQRFGRRVSQESATSIESTAEDEDMIEDEGQAELSPVAESPRTPVSPGKPPVKYPAIRKHNDKQQQQQQQQQPPPDRVAGSELLPPAHRYNVWHPPGRSSPTGMGSMVKLGAFTPAASQSRSNRPERLRNTPSPGPAASGNQDRQRTGSPEARRGPLSAAELEARYWQRQRQVANPASYWNEAPQARGQPSRSRQPQRQQHQPPSLPTPPYELPGESSTASPSSSSLGRYGTPRQQPQPSHQQRRPGLLPTPAATPQSLEGGVTTEGAFSSSSQDQSEGQGQSKGQGQGQASLLLAKRRGAEKAAALVLPNANGKGLAGGDGAPGSRRGKSGWKREETTEEHGPAPPITPGWVPELTPTRKGEDLYLNVR
ncbi:uncharacterized protein P884DRAFT_268471 [Thermothelomyces heterothallicus CBS 202.75]|uniref:uncharacterized protein n=1 Tax=Thermothelomyces heterothallicus CBS 202.75 TaxID=1149848 RepID=UPI003743F5CD